MLCFHGHDSRRLQRHDRNDASRGRGLEYGDELYDYHSKVDESPGGFTPVKRRRLGRLAAQSIAEDIAPIQIAFTTAVGRDAARLIAKFCYLV